MNSVTPTKTPLWTVIKNISFSLFEVLSKIAWPLHLGCLLAVIGVMASVLANIFGIAWDPAKPDPTNLPMHQLYDLWQICTVLIVTLLMSMALNLLRSIYMRSQKDLMSAGKLSIGDWLFNLGFLFVCFIFPVSTISIGLYAIRTLNRAMQSYLKITPRVNTGFDGNGFIWSCIV